MEAIKEMILALCVSMIIFGVIMMLTPKGNISKSLTVFLSIALVSMIVATISGIEVNTGEFRFDLSSRDTEIISSKLENTISNLNTSTSETAVNILIKEKLSAIGIDNAEISTEVDISDDNSIRISKVHIVCDLEDGETCRREVEKLGIDFSITERGNNEIYKDN
ncbi:MAG: hypothetical protein J6S13_08665 [Clostridia bacterium]|nr:hypothetical protein [Clostridia bacterium]